MKLTARVVAIVVFLTAPFAFANEVIQVPVALRPGVTADVAVRVIDNPHSVPPALDVVIVHGFAQTGATFEPLANALFSDSMGNKVRRALIIELPGHGGSALPDGMTFGELALEDYASAVLGVLAALPSHGIASDIVIAHSMGGVIVQIAQEELLSQGTSLRSRYGVRGAVLIAPVLPFNLPWSFSGTAAAILGPLVRYDPVYGLIADIPAPLWIALFYRDRAGTIVNVPSPSELSQFMAYEALAAGAQTVRLFPSTPVRANAFGRDAGTELAVVTLEQDGLFAFPGEHEGLYLHLTGDLTEKLFFPIAAADAVHNVHTFHPELLLRPIKKLINESDRQ